MNERMKRIPRNEYASDDFDDPAHHRNVYIRAFGHIPQGWHVHHIDCCKFNNELDNLIALPPQFHRWLHRHHFFYLRCAREGLIDKNWIQKLLEAYEAREFWINRNRFPDVFNLYFGKL